jgi:hypothetical protein
MNIITGNIPELAAALTPEKLVERALLDHVVALLEILRPRSEREAIRLLAQLTAVIEKGSRP